MFGPLYHITNNGNMVDVSNNDETRYDLIGSLESEYCRDSFSPHNCHRDEDTIWYNYVDINAINIKNYYEPIAALSEVLNDVEELVISDNATVKQNNIFVANRLDSPDKYRTYDLPRAQMDGGAKCTITNNINLLKNVKWYSRWFLPRVKMQGATSKMIIVPEAQGYLEVPTITPGITIDVLWYYSPDFMSTLLLDNDVLKAHKHAKKFSGQSMLKFFDELEITEMPPDMKDKINNQVLNEDTFEYNHNYGNCILCCTHTRESLIETCISLELFVQVYAILCH